MNPVNPISPLNPINPASPLHSNNITGMVSLAVPLEIKIVLTIVVILFLAVQIAMYNEGWTNELSEKIMAITTMFITVVGGFCIWIYM